MGFNTANSSTLRPISERKQRWVGRIVFWLTGIPCAFETATFVVDSREQLLLIFRQPDVHPADRAHIEGLIALITHPELLPPDCETIVDGIWGYQIWVVPDAYKALEAALAAGTADLATMVP